jgi:hypothetical protein
MIDASRVWISHDDLCHRSAFKASIDRALLVLFPPLREEKLPDRIAAAPVALRSLEAETPRDRLRERLR